MENPNEPGRRRDPMEELNRKIDRAIEELRPKVKRAFEEMDAQVDRALEELRPRVDDARTRARPKVDDWVSEMQPRLDSFIARVQAKLDALRRDFERRAERAEARKEAPDGPWPEAEGDAKPGDPPREPSEGASEFTPRGDAPHVDPAAPEPPNGAPSGSGAPGADEPPPPPGPTETRMP